jgi:hypothetical protein
MKTLRCVCGLILLSFLTSCIVAPIPSPTRRVGPAGKVGELDLKSFTPGKTSRDEVVKQLSNVDTGVKLKNGYWARWEKSKWTWVMAVGGPGAAAGGGSRFWSADNFVAEFDDAGVMKSWRIVRDAELGRELSRFIGAETKWESDERVEMDVLHRHLGRGPGCTLVLQSDYLELIETAKLDKHDASSRTAKHAFKTSPAEIVEVTTGNSEHETNDVDVGVIRLNLRFKTTKPVGDQLKLVVSPENLVEVLSYVHERASQAVIK